MGASNQKDAGDSSGWVDVVVPPDGLGYTGGKLLALHRHANVEGELLAAIDLHGFDNRPVHAYPGADWNAGREPDPVVAVEHALAASERHDRLTQVPG
jgi:hypothetical protein